MKKWACTGKDLPVVITGTNRPLRAQSLMIETFSEVTKDMILLQWTKWNYGCWNKSKPRTGKRPELQPMPVMHYCYRVPICWANVPEITIDLGNTAIRSKDQQQEAGTGYFKKVFNEKQVKPEMGNIKVTVMHRPTLKQRRLPAWGAVYWQYFENLDKITPAATPLQLTKKLFIEKNTDRGPVLQPINEGDAIKVGDKVKVRIELRVDRAMEYVHMKDMRAACMEPVNVISQYKWQGGLGYYETTKDASTNFFFGQLPKGTLRVWISPVCNPYRYIQQWHYYHSMYVCSWIYQPQRRCECESGLTVAAIIKKKVVLRGSPPFLFFMTVGL